MGRKRVYSTEAEGHLHRYSVPTFRARIMRGCGQMPPWSPSLDRIDPLQGYTPENCRLVVWMYNAAKHISSDANVLRLAQALCQSKSSSS